jgi:hypothetical protein
LGMWIPESAAEIERAARSRELQETASFDAKKALPIPSRNESLAVDVAAMSTDGGVLLYGVEQDRSGQPVNPDPIPLEGAKERVDQIVQTSIAEPPHIEIREYPTDADPAAGYLLVLIPQSARAPHQVTVGGNLRFYGRGATGNRILTEGDIARLYERRRAWERDAEQVLSRAVERSRLRATADQGLMYAVAAPLLPDNSIWDRAIASAGGRPELLAALKAAARDPQIAAPDVPQPFQTPITEWEQFGSDRARLSSIGRDQDPNDPSLYFFDVDVSRDGSAEMTSAGVIWRVPPHSELVIVEPAIAGTVASFLALVDTMYRLAGYHGHLDVGVALVGLLGAVSLIVPPSAFERNPYNAVDYQRTERVSASELAEPRDVVNRLLRHLFESTTGTVAFEPFTWTRR